MSFADADALDQVAARIRNHADDLRARASRLVAAAEATRWHSTAAATFRADVQGVARSFRRAAERVDGVAAELRRHAATVRHVQAVLAAAASAAEQAAEAGVGEAAQAGVAAWHEAGDVVGDLVGWL